MFDNLVSGLIGACIGAVALAGIQGWQLLVARREAKAAGRLIYLEVTFNIAALRAGETTTPARLLVSTQMWEQHSPRIIGLLGEVEIARAAAPYLQLDAYRVYFASGTLEMVRPRALGEDVRLMEQLAVLFVEAEKVLRPHVWAGKQEKALGDVMSKLPEPPKLTRYQRFTSVVTSIPVQPLLVALALVFVLDRAVKELRQLVRPEPKG